MSYGIMVEKDMKLASIVRRKERHVRSWKRSVMCGKIKALAAIVLAIIYFSMTWIGNSERHEAIARLIARMSFRIHEAPEFHFCSIADGASGALRAVSLFCRPRGKCRRRN